MLAEVGSILIGLSLFAVIYAAAALIIGLKKNDFRWQKSARNAIFSSTGLLMLALLLLVAAFVTDQFQLSYVYSHSSSALDLSLKLSAVWAGQEGSLLLWAFLQALFSALIAKKLSRENALETWVAFIMSLITLFFVGMTLIFSNPFIATSSVPQDGLGMNPLLRHPGMIFHPPFLYLGYVALAVPFAHALSALIVGDVEGWSQKARNWSLMAWLFLGVGLLLGMRWAYDVLGWGGYWGWDPVENAGLMPWLTATALLHGLDMQSRGKGFKVWNVVSAVLSFALVIFGTFTTRSGLIQSVHAFSESVVGPYFLVALVIVLVGSIALMIAKHKAFGKMNFPEKILSTEGAFFFALLSLMLITLSIMVGTLLPTLTGGTFTAPAEWFNRVVGPQLGVLVFLMGVGPLIGKLVRGVKASLWRLLPPVFGALAGFSLAWWGGFRLSASLIGLTVAGFSGGAALGEIGFNIGKRIRQLGWKTGIRHLPFLGRHGFGAHLIHLGVVLMAVGVIGTQLYETEQQFTLVPGDSVMVGEYMLLYEDLVQETVDDHLDTWALISTYSDSDFLTTLKPQLNYYPGYNQTMSSPAIHSSWREDLYLVLFSWDGAGQISLSAMINPLSAFLWIGGMVVLAGGVLAWWPRVNEGSQLSSRRQSVGAQIGAILGLVVVVAVIFALWGNPLNPNSGSGRPLPGETAPAFAATAIDGNEFRLADYRGEIVVVNFWATWCPQCEDELPEFEAIWRELGDQGVQFVGVAMDDTLAAVTDVAEVQDITYPLIVEEENRITTSYGVTAAPETFIVDAEGNVAYLHIGAVDAETLMSELAELMKAD
ncbi:MAG: cytochrome c biogenesis protein CcsA [Anaerolineaceae bacterium]|nr:cytochrome c biogenesis protein CcsA [Anaerolineaceae bacterium]